MFQVSQIPQEPSYENSPSNNPPAIPEVIPNADNPPPNPDHNSHIPSNQSQNEDNPSQSQEQPDTEPEVANTPPESIAAPSNDPAVETRVPETASDDEFITTHLLCCEDVIMHVDPHEQPCAWRCELEVPSWIQPSSCHEWNIDELLLATTQRKSNEQKSNCLCFPEKNSKPSPKPRMLKCRTG